MLEPVERTPDRRRRAQLRLDDNGVLRSGDRPAELAEDAAKRIVRVWALRLGQHVARAAERVVHLLEPEFAQITGDRCLRHAATGVRERGQELELCPDPLSGDDAGDQPLSLRLPEHALVLHTAALLSL